MEKVGGKKYEKQHMQGVSEKPDLATMHFEPVSEDDSSGVLKDSSTFLIGD